MATIYRKTVKGQQEIETRALKLNPRLRSLLILVDGRRSDDELVKLMPQAGQPALQTLLDDGLVEVIGVTSDAPPRAPGPPAARPAAPERGTERATDRTTDRTTERTPEQRRRDLVRALTDQVGPAAETLALRIERSNSAADWPDQLDAALRLVETMRGRGAAEALRQKFDPPAPPASEG